VIQYLENLKSFTADFTQISPDGSLSKGKFFLSKPARIRWQYITPLPLVIVMNKKLITMYDYELDEVTYTKSDNVLGSFLANEKINFGEDLLIKNYKQQNNYLYLTVTAPHNKQMPGDLVMIFQIKPLSLKKLEFIDSNNDKTSIIFENIIHDIELSKNIFVIEELINRSRKDH
jgi:outer membrane lipoprotein-sorting protein